MKTPDSNYLASGIGLILLSLLLQTGVRAQTADSSSLIRSSGPGLQFQLIGGVGVYFLSETGSSSYFRAGVDAAIHHVYSSGTQTSSSGYSGGSGGTSSGPYDQTTSSYSVSASGVWAMTVAEYAHASLYVGAGPMGSYSFEKSASTTVYNSFPGNSFSFSGGENSTTIWGLGPVALIGIRIKVFGPVTVTAEMSVSAQYQWTTMSNSSTSTYGPQGPSISTNSTSIDLTGWAVDLRDIQIGVLLEL